MSRFEDDYRDLLREVVCLGEKRPSRVGSTVSVFGTALRIDCLKHGRFPLLTQRKLFPAGVLGELAAFLRGATTVAEFKEFGCNYWDDNAAKWHVNEGVEPALHVVGEIYGYQWRRWGHGVDQLANLIKGIRNDPYSRRHLLTTYNPEALDDMCLPPCHLLAQYNVRTDQHVDCIVTMRSVDVCLGLPSDIILYATLLLLVCADTKLKPGNLIFMMGDTHMYLNHLGAAHEQINRPMHALPTFKLADNVGTNYFVPSDLEILNYNHEGAIKYELNT